MRSKLTALQVAFGHEDDISTRAEYAWNGLSRACHHHAFEFSPTAPEVHRLIHLVEALVNDRTGVRHTPAIEKAA